MVLRHKYKGERSTREAFVMVEEVVGTEIVTPAPKMPKAGSGQATDEKGIRLQRRALLKLCAVPALAQDGPTAPANDDSDSSSV